MNNYIHFDYFKYTMTKDPRQINISDYNYPLPDERIAKFPIARRDQSKLLVYDQGAISDDIFCHITDHLPAGALMVFNNTKVIHARLHFHKETGAQIEIFLLEPAEPADYESICHADRQCGWYCLVGNLKKWKEGKLCRSVRVGNKKITISATRKEVHQTSNHIHFEWDGGVSFAEILDAMGELPIPPYLNRATEESDKTTYQTVYSKIKGSVAAPTAGLHFTSEVLADIDSKGIEREELTLHVGAGTFRPVKSELIAEHEMHTETIAVCRHTIERLIAHNAKAIAVGTTSVRTLESLYYMGVKAADNPDITAEELHVDQWLPYDTHPTMSAREALTHLLAWMDRHEQTVLHSSTQIIIAPGYDYKIVKILVTNFHQPQSTLLLLVSALIGDRWHDVYDHALNNGYRFLSYGDCSLFITDKNI